jgi:hypothetical protein
VLLAAPAFAGDWYVDAVNGSNSNSGSSPSNAWRTITWAVAHAPAVQGEIIHVTGTFNAASGEQFPIVVRSGQRIVGPSPTEYAVVSGTLQTPSLIEFRSSGPTDVFSPGSGLENLNPTFAQRGVVITSTDGVMSPTLRNLYFTNITDIGVLVESSSPTRASPTFERLGVGSWGRGVVCNSTASQTQLARFSDCRFGGGTVGLTVQGTFDVSIERSLFFNDGTHGLALRAPAAGLFQTVTVRDTALLENHRNGIECAGSASGTTNLILQRCTLAGNQAASLRIGGLQNTHVSIFDSILAGQAGDIALDPGVNAQVLASNSLIRDGFSNGINGCFNADPLFRNPHDYRLTFGSPCIDRSNTAPTAGAVIDGDLDLVPAPDLGALEFQHIDAFCSISWNHTDVDIEVSGPVGATAVLKWSRQPLAANPVSTPFGQLYLPVPNATLSTFQTYGWPVTLHRQLPTSPELFGQVFSFQALIDSTASPSGKAYTSPFELTITND